MKTSLSHPSGFHVVTKRMHFWATQNELIQTGNMTKGREKQSLDDGGMIRVNSKKKSTFEVEKSIASNH